ncbi:MAG: DUF1700 domain-containing protein [Oscillospiraceae bacterium]|nr:DUF1700 domain-containing protein [Oscillospiraceae bacterium]
MNKNEFLTDLNNSLIRLSKSDRDDILLDYEEHFRIGCENGMSEEEICDGLGSPQELAATYLENLPPDAKGKAYEPPSEPEQEEEKAPFDSVNTEQTATSDWEAQTADTPSESEEQTAPPTEPNGGYTYPPQGGAANYYGAADYSKGAANYSGGQRQTPPPPPAQGATAGSGESSTSGNSSTAVTLVTIALLVFVFIPLVSALAGIWLGIIGTALGVAIVAALCVIGAFFTSNAVVAGGLIIFAVAFVALTGVFGILAYQSFIWFKDLSVYLWNAGKKFIKSTI